MSAEMKLTAEERTWLRGYRDPAHKALRIIDALTAENERLLLLFQQTHGCHESWVQKATEAHKLEARVTELTAENERLRAERQAFIRATMTEAAHAAESRLAAAKAELTAEREDSAEIVGKLAARLATAEGLLTAKLNEDDWFDDRAWRATVRAFLASAQPAATQCDHANGCTTECAREQEGAIAQCPNRRPSDGGHSLDYRDGGWCDWCGTRSPQMLERIARKQSERLKKDGES